MSQEGDADLVSRVPEAVHQKGSDGESDDVGHLRGQCVPDAHVAGHVVRRAEGVGGQGPVDGDVGAVAEAGEGRHDARDELEGGGPEHGGGGDGLEEQREVEDALAAHAVGEHAGAEGGEDGAEEEEGHEEAHGALEVVAEGEDAEEVVGRGDHVAEEEVEEGGHDVEAKVVEEARQEDPQEVAVRAEGRQKLVQHDPHVLNHARL